MNKLVDVEEIEKCLNKISDFCPQDNDVDQLDESEANQARLTIAEVGEVARSALALLDRSPEASPPVEVEPVATVHCRNGEWFGYIPVSVLRANKVKIGDKLYTSPPDTINKSAYDGAREDLAIWKKRALEAEEKVRVYNQRIIDIGAIAMTPIKSPDTEAKLKRAVEALRNVKIMLPTIANALAIADAVADNVPTKAQELPDSPISRIGKLINLPDLTNSPDLLLNGYQEIKLGINALRNISKALKDIGEIK